MLMKACRTIMLSDANGEEAAEIVLRKHCRTRSAPQKNREEIQ